MSRWDEQYKNSGVIEASNQLERRLKFGTFKIEDEPEHSEILRIKKFSKYLQTALKKIDVEIVHFPNVEQLRQHIENILGQLNSYVDDKNFGYLQSANSYVDESLVHIHAITGADFYKPIVSLSTLRSLQQKISDNVEVFKIRRKELTRDVGSLKKQIATQENHLKEMERESNAHLKSLQKQSDTNQVQLDKIHERWSKIFKDSQEKRHKEFQTFRVQTHSNPVTD